jgi:hypothetical protein
VHLLDTEEDNDKYYLIMERCESDLISTLEREPEGLAASQVRSLFGQIVKGTCSGVPLDNSHLPCKAPCGSLWVASVSGVTLSQPGGVSWGHKAGKHPPCV